MRRWDIYWADVPYEENPGISKKRPVYGAELHRMVRCQYHASELRNLSTDAMRKTRYNTCGEVEIWNIMAK